MIYSSLWGMWSFGQENCTGWEGGAISFWQWKIKQKLMRGKLNVPECTPRWNLSVRESKQIQVPKKLVHSVFECNKYCYWKVKSRKNITFPFSDWHKCRRPASPKLVHLLQTFIDPRRARGVWTPPQVFRRYLENSGAERLRFGQNIHLHTICWEVVSINRFAKVM